MNQDVGEDETIAIVCTSSVHLSYELIHIISNLLMIILVMWAAEARVGKIYVKLVIYLVILFYGILE